MPNSHPPVVIPASNSGQAAAPSVAAPSAPPSAPYRPFTARLDQYLSTVPAKHRARLTRVLGGERVSYRDRVVAMCLVCSGFEYAEIAHCRVWACPLHVARPYQRKGSDSEAAPPDPGVDDDADDADDADGAAAEAAS